MWQLQDDLSLAHEKEALARADCEAVDVAQGAGITSDDKIFECMKQLD